MEIKTNLLKNFIDFKDNYETCIIENKLKNCFHTGYSKNKENYFGENKFYQSNKEFIDNFNKKPEENNLQFYNTFENNSHKLKLINNKFIDSNNEYDCNSLTIDKNLNLKKELEKINKKLNDNEHNLNNIQYLLAIYNKKYKIFNGLSIITLDNLGIINIEEIKKQEQYEDKKIEIDELEKIIKLYNEYLQLNESKIELMTMNKKIIDTDESLDEMSINLNINDLKKELINKSLQIKKLYNNLNSDDVEKYKVDLFKIILLSKEINYHKTNNEIVIGDLVEFDFNDELKKGIVTKINKDLFEIKFMNNLDETLSINTIKIKESNLNLVKSINLQINENYKLLNRINNSLNKLNKINFQIKNKKINYDLELSFLDIDKEYILDKKIETKDEIITKIKEMCDSNKSKDLLESDFKKELLPILKLKNPSNWKYFYNDWIRRIINTFCKNRLVNLFDKELLTNIIEDKKEIKLIDYEFDDNELDKSNFKYTDTIEHKVKKVYNDKLVKIDEFRHEFHDKKEEKLNKKIIKENKISGLRNIGQTCFLNSAIQCLYSCKEFVDTLLTLNKTDDNSGLIELFYNIKNNNQENLRRNLENIKSKFIQIINGIQQDSQEILLLLLQRINEQFFKLEEVNNSTNFYNETLFNLVFNENTNMNEIVNRNVTNIENWKNKLIESTLINKYFSIFTVNIYNTNLQEFSSESKLSIENALTMNLEIINKTDIVDLEGLIINKSMTQELLESNYVNSEKHQSKIYNLKTEKLWSTSDYLILPLKRLTGYYDVNSDRYISNRNNKKIDIPRYINFNDFIYQNSPQKNREELNNYELISVSWHGGYDRRNGGHYNTWSMHNEKWFEFDDNKVPKYIENPFNYKKNGIEYMNDKRIENYEWISNILIYKRINNDENIVIPNSGSSSKDLNHLNPNLSGGANKISDIMNGLISNNTNDESDSKIINESLFDEDLSLNEIN